MPKTGKHFVFDAEAALKAATLAVIGLSSAWKYKLQESDRKEIVAETVAKAWSHRDSYDPGKASFQTWVGRIARNTLLDHIRKTKPKEDASAQADEGQLAKAPDTILMEDEGLEAVLAAVNSLPESYQRVITLLSEGKGPQKIAEILGCSPNAATIKCCRARKALREKLDEQA
jgi:RNA polymerase sigma-70 factor (ECF subfamily)